MTTPAPSPAPEGQRGGSGAPEVFVEQRGATRVIALNRPHVLNALDASLERALCAALRNADHDPGTRVVVLRGNGRAFCAGADLKERASGPARDVDTVVRQFRVDSVFVRLIEMRTPVIAAVHGYCLGGGFQVAGLCDVTIVATSARLGEPEIRFANPLLVPVTPHIVNAKQARRLLMLGGMIDAAEAVALGIASEVVPDDALLGRALELADDIARVPVASIRVARNSVRVAAAARGLEHEATVNAEILALTLAAQEAGPDGSTFLEQVRSQGAGRAVEASASQVTAEGTIVTTEGNEPMSDPLEMRLTSVRFERMGSAAIVTFDRPAVLNAMDRQLLADFDVAFERAVADEASAAVIIRGEGRAFSAGMDMKEPDLLPLPDDGQRTHLVSLMARAMRIWDADKPVIAAVHGHCLGHACDLAAAADFTVAGESARFAVPEVRHLGGVAAMLYPYLMPQKHARQFLYRGRPLDAVAAYAQGLVTTVVPDGELLDTALALAADLATIPRSGLRQMKRSINRSIDAMGMRQTLAYNLESLALVLNTQSSEELAARDVAIRTRGLGAFVADRDAAPGMSHE